MNRCRDGWPSVVLVACLAVIAAGMAVAQPRRSTVPVGRPTILAPQRIDLSKLVIPSIVSESNLEESLLWGRPEAVFGTRGVVTEDKIPRGVRLLRGQDLTRSPDLVVRATDRSVKDMAPAETVVKVHNKSVVVKPGIDVLKDPGIVKLLNVYVNVKYIVAVAHGRYNLYFKYSIGDVNKVKLPLRFMLTSEGPVAGHLAYLPYVHQEGPANNLSGYIYILTCGSNMPFACDSTSIGVKVLDADNQELGAFTKPMTYRFTKRYVDITRNDIKNYMAQPGVAKTSVPVPASGGVGSVVFQDYLYLMEPMLLLVKTNQGNYAKALLDTEAAAGGRKHIAIWDARCYAKNQATFNSTPGMSDSADSNTEYMRLFGRGGYLFWAGGFDFDRDGHNPEEGQGDLFNVCGPDSSPESQVLIGSGSYTVAY